MATSPRGAASSSSATATVSSSGASVVGHRGGVLAPLHVRAVAPGAHHDDLAVGVVADRDGVDLGGVDHVEVLGDELLEAQVAVAEVEVARGSRPWPGRPAAIASRASSISAVKP